MAYEKSLSVIYEDNHLLVVDKPAGLPTMGEEPETCFARSVEYIRHRYRKPGRVYLGVVSRLDRVTSGVIVFARTSKAAKRLNEQFAPAHSTNQGKGTFRARKEYLALVRDAENELVSPQVWGDWLDKDEKRRRMMVGTRESQSSKHAELRMEPIQNHRGVTLVSVRLHTGRKHQIRVQFSHRGHYILGDSKYGDRQDAWTGNESIGLHSHRLSIQHPTKKVDLSFTAPLPALWPKWCRNVVREHDLGGSDHA
ncbi:MAG: RluA family pseudouridine synthase [Planctomycetota bacterium]